MIVQIINTSTAATKDESKCRSEDDVGHCNLFPQNHWLAIAASRAMMCTPLMLCMPVLAPMCIIMRRGGQKSNHFTKINQP